MDYRILGPLEVRDGGRLIGLGGDKQRGLLAILLLHRNQVVSAERLIDELWGDSPPPSARRTLQAYISRLRRALGNNAAAAASDGEPDDGPLLTRGHGYELRVAPDELDLERFEAMVERGRDALASGRADEGARVLRQALGLCRGPPLGEFAYEPFARAALPQLEEIQLAAAEERVEADLALGRTRELIGELRELVAKHPLRERPRAQLMVALYRSGRQAEALEVYRGFRYVLSDQLGLEPGLGLRQLELAILQRDPALLNTSVRRWNPRAYRPDGVVPEAPARGEAEAASRHRLPVIGSLRRRRRIPVFLASSVLMVAVLAGALMAASRGGSAGSQVIGADSIGAVSPTTGAVRAVVPLGAAPSAVATGDGSIWVANVDAATISRIDPVTHAVNETIPVGTTPTGLAIGAGAVWVTNNYGQTLSRIDPAVERVVQTIQVGNAPTGAAIADGSVWVVNSSDGTLSRIDAISGTIVSTIPLGSGATDVAAGDGEIWVSDEAGDRVLRVDPQTDQVSASINVGSGPTAIAVGFGSAWVANSLDGTVSRIDPATSTVKATITLGDGAGAIGVDHSGVWVASQYAGTVSRVDPATNTVTRRITVGNRPQGVAVADGLVWVAVQAAGTSHRGGTLRVLTQGYADTFDPVLAQNLSAVVPLTNDGLTAYQHVGGSGSVQLVPDLAVSLPSPTDGGTTYTFKLRREIRYSNGQLVRPEDFRLALERDLILGPNPDYGNAFADVVGGTSCRRDHCDLSRGVATDDATNTVTFHLVAPDPEFLSRLTFPDAVSVPVGTPLHDIGLHPLPATGPYEWGSFARYVGTLIRNPFFHEWSHAAQPSGYPDQIHFRHVATQAEEIAAIERGSADTGLDGPPPGTLNELQTRFARQVYVNPAPATDLLILNTHVAPFTDLRVRRAINFAIDRAKVARLLGEDAQPTCQMLPPHVPGYRRYCPYTVDPSPSGRWLAPDVATAEKMIAASHTRGTPITIWNFTAFGTDYTSIETYLVTLLDRLGYPTKVKDALVDPTATSQFADSRNREQAALTGIYPYAPSPAQALQTNFACGSFLPDSRGNANMSEFCDHRLDAEIATALGAEGANSPNTASLWAQVDRTITDDAPAVPLITPAEVDFVSSRVGNYEYSNAGTPQLLDQLWVR